VCGAAAAAFSSA